MYPLFQLQIPDWPWFTNVEVEDCSTFLYDHKITNEAKPQDNTKVFTLYNKTRERFFSRLKYLIANSPIILDRILIGYQTGKRSDD